MSWKFYTLKCCESEKPESDLPIKKEVLKGGTGYDQKVCFQKALKLAAISVLKGDFE